MRPTDCRDPMTIATLPQHPSAQSDVELLPASPRTCVAVVTDVARNVRANAPGLWYFIGVDVCPWCGLQHMHGARREPTATMQIEHRVAHCRDGRRDYWLLIDWATVRVAARSERLFRRDRRRPPRGWTPGALAGVML